MPDFLTIKNWKKFQHYKNRNPPWIKLHYEIMTSPDWVMLADASKLLAVVCMMIASRNEGRVPNDPAYIRRVAYLDSLPNFKPLIDSGFFIESASRCKRMKADARPETETYRTETDTPIVPKGDFSGFYSAYPKRVAPKDAQRAYLKALKTATHEEIMAGVVRYANSVKGTERQYIQAPAAWLNKGRWADDYGPALVQKTGFARAGL